jgi:pimeloyl-ACP methyl ester carboxylesterase
MNPERMLTIGDVEMCVQTVGRRFVVRYDQRDTGRSSSFPPGRPGYALSDLTGVARQRAVPGAELLVLDRTGHELPRQRWDEFVGALLRHTAPRP